MGMKGLYLNRAGSTAGEFQQAGFENLKLLAKCGNLEIMQQRILRNATAWLVPADTDDDMEFFYVCSGQVMFMLDGTEQRLGPGESFYIRGLDAELLLHAEQDTQLLYVSTMPVFDDNLGFQMELTKLIEQIDEKDHYTFRHSRNVMRYSVKLREALKDECTMDIEDLVVASLFHDVGKCKIPDEILKKQGPLTPEEYEMMKQHSLESARLLATHYGERIVQIAGTHHERLNGSGYPKGLKADQLIFESRLVAVADAFDAMTTNRGYNRVKTFEAAAEELRNLPQQYDQRICDKLLELVRNGTICKSGGAAASD